MAEIKLNGNQAALILEMSEDGEIKVDIAVDEAETEASSFAADICQAIALKLINDQNFQEEILASLCSDEEAESSSG